MRSPIVALAQAGGIAAYVATFALTVNGAQGFIRPEDLGPIFGISFFLLAFVTSALICAAIVFGYPATLFFDGKKREALEVVGWTIAWCVVLLAVAGASVLLLQ